MDTNKEWFADWFDSPYYHILYKNRDYTEAEQFLNNVISFLKMPINSSVIDLACGKGRHSVFLNKAGFNVTGLDLSANSIEHAKQFENNSLHFDVADLRSFETNQLFDYGFNLFTSFAYFKSDEENQKVLNRFNACLNAKGILLLDFFNAEKIKQMQSYSETKIIDGIEFNLHKIIDDKKVTKRIEFNADGKEYYYQEEVQLLTLANFEKLFSQTGFTILNVFGNYNLTNFEPNTSDRLIFIAQKNN